MQVILLALLLLFVVASPFIVAGWICYGIAKTVASDDVPEVRTVQQLTPLSAGVASLQDVATGRLYTAEEVVRDKCGVTQVVDVETGEVQTVQVLPA